MGKPATRLYLPEDIGQQLLDFQKAGLLTPAEREEVSVALMQRLSTPVRPRDVRIGNRNAPLLVQQQGV